MSKKVYLVQTREYNSVESCNSLMSASEIISRIDMNDCYEEEMTVFDVSVFGVVEELKIHGTWHDSGNPLYIKLTNAEGEIIISGFGTDH